MDRALIKIIDGPFADFEGEVVSGDRDMVLVRLTIFGRETTVDIRRDQLETPMGIEALRRLGERDEDIVALLRSRITEQHDDLAKVQSFDFFLKRVDKPEDDLVAEWDAYVTCRAEAEIRAEGLKVTALKRFDEEVAFLPVDEATARVEGDPENWLPADAVRQRQRSQYPDPEGSDPESRLLAVISGEAPPPPSPMEQAMERRIRARSAADMRDYTVWRTSVRPPGQHAQARSDALAQVERERAAIEERFARDWGVELPDSIFRFWAFLQACGPIERQALDDLELCPFGIMDLFDAPAHRPRDGIDVRVHGRYYRDPPEFLTFMHGGTDGLHFGLWFDDGRTCDGVTAYYNNDGGGVGLPSGTPLEAVRATLEVHWHHVNDPAYIGEDDDTRPYETELAERRHRIRLLREFLMTFETGDHPEEGEEYDDATKISQAILDHGHPNRIQTLDGGGALVHGETAIDRKRQKPYDDYEFCTNLRRELTEDPAALEAHIAEARRRCAAGNPADALTLGRDLHWISGGDAKLERYANELLVSAYNTLGRPNLAAIAGAHHRHRDLPQVSVLRDH
ncbi:DUF2228 domain-containing protein [Actinomadura madurae]|uniref:DUF2228 domain-containing protein n=1 Tax=Actinomadura madurae TaxID=1993 RepID=UPI000D9560FF|nr:DUF2228 domain-containing protein [Actinomadura madurae]SPT63212.1 transcription antitermination protein NusG [Actinomadura madurae]